MIKGCKGKVSEITKNEERKSVLEGMAEDEADQELAFVPESPSKYLCICGGTEGAGWGAGVRGLRSGGETGADAQSAHAALKWATLHFHFNPPTLLPNSLSPVLDSIETSSNNINS